MEQGNQLTSSSPGMCFLIPSISEMELDTYCCKQEDESKPNRAAENGADEKNKQQYRT